MIHRIGANGIERIDVLEGPQDTKMGGKLVRRGLYIFGPNPFYKGRQQQMKHTLEGSLIHCDCERIAILESKNRRLLEAAHMAKRHLAETGDYDTNPETLGHDVWLVLRDAIAYTIEGKS